MQRRRAAWCLSFWLVYPTVFSAISFVLQLVCMHCTVQYWGVRLGPFREGWSAQMFEMGLMRVVQSLGHESGGILSQQRESNSDYHMITARKVLCRYVFGTCICTDMLDNMTYLNKPAVSVYVTCKTSWLLLWNSQGQ